MSKIPPNQKNDVESTKNQLRQELDERIFELVPEIVDGATISRTPRALPDSEPDTVNGLSILFLKNKEYIESEPNEGGGYPPFGTVSKVDGQGNYTVTVGCKIEDDDESSEYWEVEYSVVELT